MAMRRLIDAYDSYILFSVSHSSSQGWAHDPDDMFGELNKTVCRLSQSWLMAK